MQIKEQVKHALKELYPYGTVLKIFMSENMLQQLENEFVDEDETISIFSQVVPTMQKNATIYGKEIITLPNEHMRDSHIGYMSSSHGRVVFALYVEAMKMCF